VKVPDESAPSPEFKAEENEAVRSGVVWGQMMHV
jgi:hypothetical protein